MAFAADYVDVAERIRVFKEAYPDGTLQSFMPPYIVDAAGKTFVVYSAAAYRTPDDPRPGIGWAWEPVPGPTPYTRDSELMNSETSAWGRAIVALGFPTKKIASADEVRNRSENHEQPVARAPQQMAPRQPQSGGSDADVVISFGKHKGRTIGDLFNAGGEDASYLLFVAHKMDEGKSENVREDQEAVRRFLQVANNKYDASVTGDPGPVEDSAPAWGQGGLDDDVPFQASIGGDR